ncbi:PREDICTED: vacuolar protein sorting-associated protein 52 homolog [Rhagoletis zephyria]|uniref:vacuolar protein sorting-associated protein 52 homolog n=1 Tax=Rhagoletis zephyria TaxID=28612 RepID=UPI0008114637|nr:PREDICTED: vacuolar protein sorting-associated protein 52 homolog [Rhagoletis zephyria]
MRTSSNSGASSSSFSSFGDYFNSQRCGEIAPVANQNNTWQKTALEILLHDHADWFFGRPKKTMNNSSDNSGSGNEYDENIVKEILNAETDLRLYSAQVEKALTELENDTIADYIKEADNITELHSQITSSDLILERLEGMLCAFQADLSNICQEILSLQELSASLNIRLKNKQAIRAEMSDFIEDIIIPEAVIKHIVETPVSEKEFMEQLYILDHKISFVKEQSFREAKSCIDVMEILNNLKSKAILKIREYILKKIYSCRKPMTNFSIVQNALLKNKFFFKFLATHEREIAHGIIGEYTDTMGKVYFSYFKEYISKLSKLIYEDLPDKDDLLGNDETAKNKSTSLFSLKSTTTMKQRSNVFALGNRESLLNDDLEASLIVPHVAVKSEANIKLCDLNKMGAIDNRPHVITRRYAEFSAAIMIINDTFPDERVSNLLSILQSEVVNLILRMSTQFPKPKDQFIFIINNYDIILGVLLERKKEDSNEAEMMREQLNKKILDFVEEMLYPHFGAMISFVKECESLVERNDTETLKKYEMRVGDLIRNFNLNWRRALEQVSRDIMASFTNFKNGNNIQQIALTQFVQYYHKFQKMADGNLKDGLRVSALVNYVRNEADDVGY